MKFCPNCGNKLETTSNYCPKCGSALKTAVASATEKSSAGATQKNEAKTEAQKRKPLTLREKISRSLLAGFLIIAFIFIAFYLPGAHWQHVNAVGNQYYEQRTVFNNDLSELNSLSESYASAPLENATLSRKATLASAYALKAKQAVTSWNYFRSFLDQNDGLLKDYNVNSGDAKKEIDSGLSAVKTETQLMHSELRDYASGDAAIAGVLKALEEVESADSKNAGH